MLWTELHNFSSPQCHVSTFSVHLCLSPAWKLRRSPCTAVVRLCMSTQVCVRDYASGTAWLPCSPFSNLVCQSFDFPSEPSGNWKQRLSLEVCFIFVCLCVYMHTSVCLRECILLMHVCIYFQGSSCVLLCKQIAGVFERCAAVSGWWDSTDGLLDEQYSSTWEPRQSLLHMQSWRHGPRLSRVVWLFIRKVSGPLREEGNNILIHRYSERERQRESLKLLLKSLQSLCVLLILNNRQLMKY